MIVEGFTNASIFGKIFMVIPIFTVALALAYALKPTERKLALLRPLSLAAIFGALAACTVGLASIFFGMSATATFGWQSVYAAFAESLVPLFGAFGCLSVSWLLAAVGMRRTA